MCCVLQGLGSTSGLTKLFRRVGDLAKGVIVGQAATALWALYPYAASAARAVFPAA